MGIKFLGINLDENLSWKQHIDIISTKISKAIHVINRVKHILPMNALKTLYYSLVQSHLNYGLLIWGNSFSINKLVKLQKRALRVIYNKPFRSHTDSLFKDGNILKVNDMYRFQCLLFIFDFKHNLLPKSFVNFYPDRPSDRLTRQLQDIYTPQARTTFSTRSMFHNAPKIWNISSNNIKSSPTRRMLKLNFFNQTLNTYATTRCNNPMCSECNN